MRGIWRMRDERRGGGERVSLHGRLKRGLDWGEDCTSVKFKARTGGGGEGRGEGKQGMGLEEGE